MEATAKIKHLRSTARKARLVADAIRGKSVSNALIDLQYGIKKDVAQDIAKVLKSAVANLQSNNSETTFDADDLKIKEICVDNGPIMKRFRARAQGRYGRILKRMCHISITVTN